MATPVFAVRGNSLDAYYSVGEKKGTALNTVALVSGAGPISGSYIDITDTAKVKTMAWSGFRNTANGRSMSILLRFAPTYTGAPASRRQLWTLGGGTNGSGIIYELAHEATSGNLLLHIKNETQAICFNAVNLGAWTAGVSGTYYDFLFVWDGTTTANAAKLYIDNTLLGSGSTASTALTASWDNTYFKSIALGCGILSTVAALKVDEFVIWDGAQSSSSCDLVGGSGALNGASRTALVDVPNTNGPAQISRGRIVNKC